MGVLVLGMFGADLSQWVLIEGSTMQPTSQPPNVIHSEVSGLDDWHVCQILRRLEWLSTHICTQVHCECCWLLS